RDSHRMAALFRKTRVIHDPSRQPLPPRHRGQHLAAYFLQQRGIAPSRIGHDVMQRLVHLAHLAGRQTRSHRLDALPLYRQQQAFRVVLDGNNAISVPGSPSQPLQIDLQAPRLAGEIRLAAVHRPQRTAPYSSAPGKSAQGTLVYNTVVLGWWWSTFPGVRANVR